jgi:hypothetical protein
MRMKAVKGGHSKKWTAARGSHAEQMLEKEVG